ncbi:MAG: hypothetical protein H0V01_06035 [Bacteroidetes bacterium]|nr:hypothetical protein [Bacteroidota bacterium]HET6244071.1 hypothetical protein [Bacteroidia bacterium]
MILPGEFKKLPLDKKYEFVKNNGDFIATRYYQGFEVHLYGMKDFYVEVWKRFGLDYIEWIEVVNSNATLRSYLGNINLDDLF